MRDLFGISAVVAALAFSPVTAAAKVPAQKQSSVRAASAVSTLGRFSAAPASAQTRVFDVSGIFSIDPFGSPINEVFFLDIGAGSEVTGLSWNLTFFADTPSWLSEGIIALTDAAVTTGVFFTPGIGDDFPGTGTYAGMADYTDLGLNFFVGNDGLLRLEFWESFDDFPNEWDGIWQSGSFTVQYNQMNVVPEPATWGLMIAGFGVIGVTARRRKSAITKA